MLRIGNNFRRFSKKFHFTRALFSTRTENLTKITLKGRLSDSNALITLSGPETNILKRTPLSLCLVVDVSGSMGTGVPIKTSSGAGYEDYGFSRLDLVKHALKMIQESLGPEDEISIIKFSNDTTEVLPVTKMDDVGKLKTELALNWLEPSGGTNLWGGLKQGLDIMNNIQNRKNASILLLTDGEPNIIPPRGHLPSLKRFKQNNKGILPAKINTFGFGYSLDSQLLWELSKESLGNYCFIPDGSFVGTVFINALSNMMSVAASDVKLTLKDISSSEVPNSSYLSLESNGSKETVLHLSTINFSQSRNIILARYQLKDAKSINAILEYKCPFSGANYKKDVKIEFEESDSASSEVEIQRIRMATSELILNLKSMSTNIKSCHSTIEDFIYSIEDKSVKSNPFIKDLLLDLKDQVKVAFSKQEFYNTWGAHYLPSLGMAHLNETCNNFKDAGVQHYAGSTFNQIRDELDEVFLKITPPKPSRSISGGLSVVTLTQMSMFHDKKAPCFHGDSMVRLQNGEQRAVKDIKKNDLLKGVEATGSRVISVVKTRIHNKKCELVELEGGLKITPWHPILYKGEFVFPSQIKRPVLQDCDFVYNFVLANGHSIEINDTKTVTLGHGLTEGVVAHEYFGTQKVIEDLKTMRGWSEGLIELEEGCCIRDKATGNVNKMVQGARHAKYEHGPIRFREAFV